MIQMIPYKDSYSFSLKSRVGNMTSETGILDSHMAVRQAWVLNDVRRIWKHSLNQLKQEPK